MNYQTQFGTPAFQDAGMALLSHPTLSVGFNSPKKLTGKSVHGLPPFAQIRPYEVDAYPACPNDWMRGNGRDRSFFVPVEQERGLWLNFNKVNSHKKHVAVLVSIQGLNPVTGRPAGLKLEQYLDKCPVHTHDFEGGRFCKECGFAWPKQNYLCTTGQPGGFMWLDGFRGADGTVRQYYFTAETLKGVAQQLLGEKRVFAIGVAFFLSKSDRPVIPQTVYGYNPTPTLDVGKLSIYSDAGVAGPIGCDMTYNDQPRSVVKRRHAVSYTGRGMSLSSSATGLAARIADEPVQMMAASSNVSPQLDAETIDLSWSKSKLEIAAGEKIDQKIYDDAENLDFWESEPAGTVYINYCPADLVEEILKKGQRATQVDGFLQNLKVGA